MSSRVATVAALALVASCGKSPTNQETTPEKVTEAPPTTPPTPPGKPQLTAKPNEPAAQVHSADHAVYSLVDNRLSAHLSRGGGLVVNAGSAGFAKYLRLGNVMQGWKRTWELRKDEGGVKVARMANKNATVYVPLSKDEAGRGTLRIRAFTKDKNALTVKVNDNKDLSAKLDAGWSTAEVTVPDGQLREGENALSLSEKNSGVEIAWMQIGGTTPVGDDGQTTFYDGTALVIPKAGAMSWYVMVPDKAKLAGDASCEVGVRAMAEDGATATGKLAGHGATVDLSALAGKAVRLDLEAGCDAKLANAALVVPGPMPEVKRGEPPKYVAFIIMDALRADKVHAFNPKTRVDTPNFDKLAESSALFMQTYQQGNESQVSHASIWSSNYLAKHKAMEMKDILAEKWTTIDEVAKKAGMYV
ncbi:MAG TPA: sulfatase-like hydrolase/transferase, partial [Kofleriaceae bacterium]|nr:sulfatase-like hydrolase/transferase [Kofleriaceae bacterium]